MPDTHKAEWRGNTQGSVYDPWNVPELIPLHGGAINTGRDYVVSAQTLPIYETAENYTRPVGLLLKGKLSLPVAIIYSD